MTATLLVGNCSWTDPTLIACRRFYPPGVSSAEARLRYYATQFALVEVDSTYYAPPSERNARLWVERTPRDFVFNVKAFALLTGHGARPDRLPGALRSQLTSGAADKRNVYLRDLSAGGVELLWEIHRAALAPLHAAGKLGAVLFQFPPWFRAGKAGREYLGTLRERLPGFTIAVEFRGGGWLGTDAAAETLALLEREGLCYVAVDEPQGFASSTPPVAEATGPLAVVRLHGRNAQMWDAKTAAASDRFNYLYSESELREWVPRVRRLAERAAGVHVLFNNNYEDYGVRNARQMRLLLDEEDSGDGKGDD